MQILILTNGSAHDCAIFSAPKPIDLSPTCAVYSYARVGLGSEAAEFGIRLDGAQSHKS